MKPFNQPNIFPVGTVLNATRTSAIFQVYNAFIFAVQVVFTGTPTGNFKLQGSCDPAEKAIGMGPPYTNPTTMPVNWTDIAGTTVTVSAAGSFIVNYADPGFNWVRVVYTDTSGGTSTAVVTVSTANVKGL